MVKNDKITATPVAVEKISSKMMVTRALKELNDKRGSSLQAIKKFILENFANVDIVHYNPYIKKYLKSAIEKGSIIKTHGTGTGSSGSFKLAKVKDDQKKSSKKPDAKKKKVAKSSSLEKKDSREKSANKKQKSPTTNVIPRKRTPKANDSKGKKSVKDTAISHKANDKKKLEPKVSKGKKKAADKAADKPIKSKKAAKTSAK